MPRKAPEKHTHTCPENAGEQNLVHVALPKDEDGLMNKALPVYKHGDYIRTTYKGLWTEEAFTQEISDFFDYCSENDLKPTKPALRLWLNANKDTYNEWEKFPEKYGYKSVLIRKANDLMELYLQGQIDKYPTGSIFLLKTSHGHVEQSKLDVTTNGQTLSSSDELKEAIHKLGLDK